MSSDHYANYVEKLQLIFTAEPTENLVSTLYPSLYPTFAPTVYITRIVEPSSNNNPDITMVVAISVATSAFATICMVFTGIYWYYLRNRQRLDAHPPPDSSQEFGVFELADICNDGQNIERQNTEGQNESDQV